MTNNTREYHEVALSNCLSVCAKAHGTTSYISDDGRILIEVFGASWKPWAMMNGIPMYSPEALAKALNK